MPPYSIVKDLFEYFDKRRDGVIDQNEWMDTFSKFDYIPQTQITQKKLDLIKLKAE